MSIRGYKISNEGVSQIPIPAGSLDEWTRGLPQGFYTTFTTHSSGTRVLGLKDHLERLYKPAKITGLRPSVDSTQLREQLASLVGTNLPLESRVRLILARSSGEVFAGLEPFQSVNPSIYTDGVRVILSEVKRRDPRIKDSAFITSSSKERRLVGDDVYEVLLTRGGRILEGMTSNFYVVKGRTLITAREGILLGVTRKVVIRLARGEGMKIEYRAPAVEEEFNEAFITSSSRGVVPVVTIDGLPVGEGSVGSLTAALMRAYGKYLEQHSQSLV